MIESITDFLLIYPENWDSWGPQIYAAVWVTIKLTICSFTLATVMGLLIAVGKMSPIKIVRGFCIGYIEVARGIPTLAILFLLYFEPLFLRPLCFFGYPIYMLQTYTKLKN